MSGLGTRDLQQSWDADMPQVSPAGTQCVFPTSPSSLPPGLTRRIRELPTKAPTSRPALSCSVNIVPAILSFM